MQIMAKARSVASPMLSKSLADAKSPGSLNPGLESEVMTRNRKIARLPHESLIDPAVTGSANSKPLKAIKSN